MALTEIQCGGSWTCTGYPAFLNIGISGFPAAGCMTFYLR